MKTKKKGKSNGIVFFWYLVALNAPHFDDVRFDADHLEGVEAIENGTSIRSVVFFNINARRVRFRKVCPVKAHTPQRFRNELEMINFLLKKQTNK